LVGRSLAILECSHGAGDATGIATDCYPDVERQPGSAAQWRDNGPIGLLGAVNLVGIVRKDDSGVLSFG